MDNNKKIIFALGALLIFAGIFILYLLNKKCPACSTTPAVTASASTVPDQASTVSPVSSGANSADVASKISALNGQLAAAKYKLFNMQKANVSQDQLDAQNSVISQLTAMINTAQAQVPTI
jgi:hypothetical protein